MLHYKYWLIGLGSLLILAGVILAWTTSSDPGPTHQSRPPILLTAAGGPALLNPDYAEELPDSVWEEIVPLLPLPKPKKKIGRPRMKDRQAMAAIFYLLRTDCPWNALPRHFGPYSTVHGRLQEWKAAGLLRALRQKSLLPCSAREGFGENDDAAGHRAAR
jgi:hypothetical protein